MLRSIRWTLQVWYAAILVIVVAGIGTGSYFEIRKARLDEIDQELDAAGRVLVAKLRGTSPSRTTGGHWGGPGGGGRFGPTPGRDRDNFWDPGGGFGPSDNDFTRGPPGGDFGHDPGAPPVEKLPRTLELPAGFLDRYGGTGEDDRSFLVWQHDHDVVKSWGAPYDPANLPPYSDGPDGDNALHRTRGGLHEVILAGPAHARVLVSSSVNRVESELQQLLWMLAATGAAVTFLGLTGGWVLSRGALRPIKQMTKTAASLSVTDLSGRIDEAKVPGELRQLASVLNASFDRLEGSFARQTRFTADASHELRTPLAVILSHTQLALTRDRSNEDYKKTLETCRSASTRMKNLVESLLLLSHADAGELALDCKPADLREVAEEAVALLQPLADERSIHLSTDCQASPCSGDALRLGQVVVNLVTNAIRYNRDGGGVLVCTRGQDDRAVLTVTDTGVGIKADDQAMVFDRFFRADKARSRGAGGSGLGLAICKSIIQAHGGTVSLASEAGVGTCVTVTLPGVATCD